MSLHPCGRSRTSSGRHADVKGAQAPNDPQTGAQNVKKQKRLRYGVLKSVEVFTCRMVQDRGSGGHWPSRLEANQYRRDSAHRLAHTPGNQQDLRSVSGMRGGNAYIGVLSFPHLEASLLAAEPSSRQGVHFQDLYVHWTAAQNELKAAFPI